jgi:peptidoglycan hydrolase CwlO-like protein
MKKSIFIAAVLAFITFLSATQTWVVGEVFTQTW